ncbi:MAG TPA: E3 binding domain-containing protein, partial [Phycisphaerales bacterium]|nr:E3 binding domain-containing protein [Phycisphaerales bacterium]
MSHQKTSSNPNDFILPDLGEGVHEAELIKWRVEVGQAVSEHDILAEMETDKALVEVPSPRTGVIAALHGKEGEICKVGDPLVTYAGDGGGKPEPKAAPAKSSAPASNGSHKPVPAPAAEAEPEDAGTVVGKMGGALAGITAEAGKALATPAVRRLARDLGVDIDTVPGTGIGGRVLEKDVRGTATLRVASAPSTPTLRGGASPSPSPSTAPPPRPPPPPPPPPPRP